MAEWTNKHAFYLGKIMGELYRDMKVTMDTEEFQVYDRVLRAIETIADMEVYELPQEEQQPLPEPEEDTLH